MKLPRWPRRPSKTVLMGTRVPLGSRCVQLISPTARNAASTEAGASMEYGFACESTPERVGVQPNYYTSASLSLNGSCGFYLS